MTTNPKPVKATKATKATTAKVIPIKPAAKTTSTASARKAATVTPSSPAKPRTPRGKKTTAAPVRFPNEVLGYLEIALEGPVGPGGIAHRPVRYPVNLPAHHGRWVNTELIGAACQPTTTEPGPDHNPDTGTVDPQKVPTIRCHSHSAAFVQARGAIRCTRDKCWPIQSSEIAGGQR
jgi:hypothetical protein